jgi:lipopolysaccharide/colanic/teichoic acid biosynthesis glycosyltransferase
MYKIIFKPLGDLFFSITLLIIFSPIFILIMTILFFSNRGKIFFCQLRPGLKAKSFRIIKFKTMIDAFDKNGNPLPDHIRLTKFGSFVRTTSLDELPQLINVLKGDMSLIGPRPLLMEYLPLYDSNQIQRHNVKPGITGLAQIKGRNAISWDEKFKLDIIYVKKISFYYDIKILINTFVVVLLQKGIYFNKTQTTTKFKN